MRAKALKAGCNRNSVICRPCFDPAKKVQVVSTSDVFKEGSGLYASFAKISEKAVTDMWNMMKLPFQVTTTQLEHAFISNLKEPMITAGIHANPMTSSMAIQFSGKKTWLFFDSKTYLDKMGAIPSAPILLPRKAPAGPYKLYVYNSLPGDILFFPESYAHIVYTYEGPNVMVNYRKMHVMNFLRQPLTWIAAAINTFRSPLAHDAGRVAGSDLQQQSVPEKEINELAYNIMDGMCDGDETLTAFDKEMVSIFKEEYKKHSKV